MAKFSWLVSGGLSIVGSLMFAFTVCAARPVNPDLYAGLQWRNVGPFHGGRAAAVTGVNGEPGVYYVGTPEGGIWKTTSAGVTWFPIFDQVKQVDSIGAITVATSNPNIVYAGTGDATVINPFIGSLGDGMWKSTNAGRTWQHIGLDDTVMIDSIVVNPHNPNVVVVSALGNATHLGGGVYRTTNGGKTWIRVLKPAKYRGTREVVSDWGDPRILLAVTEGNGGPFFKIHHGPKAKPKPPLLFKSMNGGRTWAELKIPPFPGRVSVAVARQGRLIYIVGNNIKHGSGLFRSVDGGLSWQHMAKKDKRISNGQGNYSCGVFLDPQNPNILYTVSTAMYRSTNGGVTFHSFKGAPGGEDYHSLWIDPHNATRMEVASDQGASVTINGGRTWSLWYTEPISQIYHVATTYQYPYWIVGAQQDTGAVMISSRSNWGQVDFTDWSPLPSSEFGYIAPDPLHPRILYGIGYGPGGGGGGLIKINMLTGQWENIAPNFGANAKHYWASRSLPMKFDTVFDPSALYVAYQCLLVTRNGGSSWHTFSPALITIKGKPLMPCGKPLPPSKKKAKRPRNPFKPAGPYIVDFSISKVKPGVVWTVSSNNQIYNTFDGGKRWNNLSNIPGLPPHAHLHTIEAGDAVNTAYVTARISIPHKHKTIKHKTVKHKAGATTRRPAHKAIPPVHEDTDVPLIWRTTDGGKTWVSITRGLPRNQRTGSWVNVLRVDPKQPGLLFAGTGTTVYVSFDHGDHWQSLRQNLPSTSITDLVVHTQDHMNDLVISTFGRGFWVLDDFTPLREIAVRSRDIASSRAYLFKPEEAIRARVNSNWDQPFSIEVPHAPNPPYGVIVDYDLRHQPHRPIQLQVFDAHGNLIRTYTSTLPAPIKGQAYPRYWLASPGSRALGTHVGLNRFVWNLRYAPPPAFHHDLENQMNTVAGATTPGPHGPQVIPGVYTLKLTVNGHVYTRHVTVMNDPRVGQSRVVMAALRAQNRMNRLAYQGMQQSYNGYQEVNAVKVQLASLMHRPLGKPLALQAKKLEASLTKVGGKKTTGGFLARLLHPKPKPNALRSFVTLNNDYNALVSLMQVGIDMRPTPTQLATLNSDCRQYDRTVTVWKSLRTKQLATFNVVLAKNHLRKLKLAPVTLAEPSCSVVIDSR
ncbi:MAG: WD40/YVTN/BNR-like repeat-containing protein [Gammaproteobacteria bacterium]